MRLRTVLPSTLLAVTAVVGSAAAPASAGGGSTPSRPSTSAPAVDLAAARERCIADIDLRVAKLAALTAGLTSATAVTAGHRSAQQASLAAASSGLAQLDARVRADTDARTLKADCESVVADYRVFALRAPQTGYVIAGDAQAAAAARVQATVPALSDAIAKLAAAGKDVSAAQAALADLQAKLADATPKAQGLADSVIPFTPAGYNANKALLTAAHTTALRVRADLAAARNDVKTIGAALKAAAS